MSTCSSLRPTRCGSSTRRIVSTSGSSGISADRLEDDRAWVRSVVGELVGGEHFRARLLGRFFAVCVHLGQHVAGCDLVAALLEAADSDRVIDLVGLRLSPGTKTERGRADGNRADRGDEAVAL